MYIEPNPDFLNHVAMCLDLGLDPENPKLEWVEYEDKTPWFTAHNDRQHSGDIDMQDRSRFNPKIEGLEQPTFNNIVR